jgi:hypothetical protein
MEKRFQVFISSTFVDLQDERQEVIQALLELDCIPAGMELFPASDDDRWSLIKRVIDDCDYYIVIVGGRYGSLDEKGISYTEREFDYAVEAKKPVMGFLHADPGIIAAQKTDLDPDARRKLEAFRQKVGQRMCKYWKTSDELGGVVSRSLIKLTRTHPAEGWIRASHAITPETLEELSWLRSRVHELEQELEQIKGTVPKGTEGLAQGKDPWAIDYVLTAYDEDTYEDDTYRGSVTLTWDEIFSKLAPLMFDECGEDELRKALISAVRDKFDEEDLLAKLPENSEISNFSVSNSEFQKVKVQLVALRLIEKSVRKRGVRDTNTYWTLTPYGETYLMQLSAIPRPDQS